MSSAFDLSGWAESSPDVEIVIAENHCGFPRDPIFVQDGNGSAPGGCR